MKVTKEGRYRDANGRELSVFNVGAGPEPYFRAHWNGGYYNVNETPEDKLQWEMVEFVRDFNIDSEGFKS